MPKERRSAGWVLTYIPQGSPLGGAEDLDVVVTPIVGHVVDELPRDRAA
jgi:hypothetical protein